MAWILAPLLLVCALAWTLGRGTRHAGVVTFVDYFEAGERSVEALLDQRVEGSGHISSTLADRVERAVVRVRVKYDMQPDGTTSCTTATGTLIDDGRFVVSVAHDLPQLMDRPEAVIEIVLADGTILTGERPDLAHYDVRDTTTDWSVFKIVGPPRGLPSLELGDSLPGERLVLGFPGRYGRDNSGKPKLDDAFKRTALVPLRILCRTSSDDPSRLELVAGCVPMGGISGGPCIDERGMLVGIQRAIIDTQEADQPIVILDVVPIDAAKSTLALLHPVK